MAKKKQTEMNNQTEDEGGEKRTRSRVDYIFKVRDSEGKMHDLDLSLNSIKDVATVKKVVG